MYINIPLRQTDMPLCLPKPAKNSLVNFQWNLVNHFIYHNDNKIELSMQACSQFIASTHYLTLELSVDNNECTMDNNNYICKHHLGLEQVNWPSSLLPPSLKLAHTIVILSLNTIRIIYLKLTHYSAVWLNCGKSTWCVQSIWFSVLLIMILWNESIMSECADFDNFVTNYGAYMQIWKQAFANFTAGKIKFRRDTSLNTSQDNNCITVSDILPIYRIKL